MRVDDLFISVPTLATPWCCCSLASRQATNEGKGVLGTDLLRLFPLMQIRDHFTMCSSECEPNVSAYKCLSVS